MLSSRIKENFNKKDFSDINLIVDEGNCVFYGHKLLLSLISPVFACNFYEDRTETLHIKHIDVATFTQLLKFIYTEEIEFKNLKEAQKLKIAAKRYEIFYLEQKCKHYLDQHTILPDEVCQIFEASNNESFPNSHGIKESCMYTFSENTKAVFNSKSFLEAKLSTVETILKMDTLNIDSEICVLEAVADWGKFRCSMYELPVNSNLRKFVGPLLKYIRFLTFDFRVITSMYQILTPAETCALTSKFLRPHAEIKIPETVCATQTPRWKSTESCSDMKEVMGHVSELDYESTSSSISGNTSDTNSDDTSKMEQVALAKDYRKTEIGQKLLNFIKKSPRRRSKKDNLIAKHQTKHEDSREKHTNFVDLQLAFSPEDAIEHQRFAEALATPKTPNISTKTKAEFFNSPVVKTSGTLKEKCHSRINFDKKEAQREKIQTELNIAAVEVNKPNKQSTAVSTLLPKANFETLYEKNVLLSDLLKKIQTQEKSIINTTSPAMPDKQKTHPSVSQTKKDKKANGDEAIFWLHPTELDKSLESLNINNNRPVLVVINDSNDDSEEKTKTAVKKFINKNVDYIHREQE